MKKLWMRFRKRYCKMFHKNIMHPYSARYKCRTCKLEFPNPIAEGPTRIPPWGNCR
jgi:hypothetical protein